MMSLVCQVDIPLLSSWKQISLASLAENGRTMGDFMERMRH